MIGRKLTKTLPLLPYAGTFGVFSACGCGQCPACLGASAGVVGLAIYIGTKKLLSLKGRGGGEGSGEGEKAQGGN
ncbi:MAG: hypothetical protein ABDH29_01945 [Aquificaceae bacterium]